MRQAFGFTDLDTFLDAFLLGVLDGVLVVAVAFQGLVVKHTLLLRQARHVSHLQQPLENRLAQPLRHPLQCLHMLQ